MTNEDMLMEEEEYQKEQIFMNAEKEFEEWLWWQEEMKVDQKRKEAKIIIRKQETIVMSNDNFVIDE